MLTSEPTRPPKQNDVARETFNGAEATIALSKIETADRGNLLRLWAERFNRPCPSHMQKPLLRRILLHEAQMAAAGGHALRVQRRVDRLAGEAPKAIGPAGAIRIKPGTRLLREWGGETHHVIVLQGGFEYRSAKYKSLSQIARAITGTRWSGPMFFGLKEASHGN